ncbi:SDR family oxidoreductase [Bordetella bronchiseptica]|uniref:Oxidoreductase YgfF n=2 Tax=Bordetella bronchiseptica TaxID=518 RepID=A0ABR4R8G2_BORBO|nr:SDR family oxidoreductase [Bordetella bronchiseptica]SHR44367.1 short-chain dehydrogenase [Mycobacteroides abscessus subsp. abscessus]AWP74401.1 NAD(P)-dependent oxidoreductase [Bordetella bronchiseptica]AZW21200.1 NAD(P)-dependent oxidoreductase [Bordetella bronchiseptica]KCV30929.1 oxidoreductase YgfF [Bordetella bronchiseptica 00-P-2796]KDB94630.1 oxidoreductase YgfF [Bordetella bronchiseptica D993]
MDQRGLFVVTGGSRGIGAAIARLAARDYPVAILYRADAAAAEAVAGDIAAQGGRAVALQADVGDEASLMDAFARLDRLGRIAVLVNNAGVTGGVARVEDVARGALEEVWRVNVLGAFLAAREAVRRMSTRRGGAGGAIVNVSSGAAQLGSAGSWVHYAATKGALDTMTVGLAREVAGEGIRVNAVRPGVIDTEVHAQRTPEQLQRMVGAIPLGRMGTAGEIAQAVVWLAGEQASYVTGCLLDARGGF